MIQVGTIGSIDEDYRNPYIYYMVEFSSSPYTLQENKTTGGKLIDYGQ